jgi:hypothetical protein
MKLANTGHISIEEAINLLASAGNDRNKTGRLIERELLRQGEHTASDVMEGRCLQFVGLGLQYIHPVSLARWSAHHDLHLPPSLSALIDFMMPDVDLDAYILQPRIQTLISLLMMLDNRDGTVKRGEQGREIIRQNYPGMSATMAGHALRVFRYLLTR